MPRSFIPFSTIPLALLIATPALACIVEPTWSIDHIVHDLPACATARAPEPGEPNAPFAPDDPEAMWVQNDCASALEIERLSGDPASWTIDPDRSTQVGVHHFGYPVRGGDATTRYAWRHERESGTIEVQQSLRNTEGACDYCSITVGARPTRGAPLLALVVLLGLTRRRWVDAMKTHRRHP